MLAIIDYGVGNLYSLKSSFKFIGAETEVMGDAHRLSAADKIILPGVGAFSDAAGKLKERGMFEALLKAAERGTPILGICLGMQLLFEKSFEYGEHEGLGLIKGSVKAIAPMIDPALKVPHIGWNGLDFPENRAKNVLFKYTDKGEHVYFVHSYHGADCKDAVTATAEYGIDITAAVAEGNVYGTQFHPEKSGDTGLRILRAFCEI